MRYALFVMRRIDSVGRGFTPAANGLLGIFGGSKPLSFK